MLKKRIFLELYSLKIIMFPF